MIENEFPILKKYSLPPLTRHRKGNENPVELAGVELAREKAKLFNPVQFLSKDVFLKRVSRSLNFYDQ